MKKDFKKIVADNFEKHGIYVDENGIRKKEQEMLTPENIAEITKNVSKKENQEVLELFTTYYSRISKFDEYDDRIKFVILRDEILKRMEGK